MDTSVGLQVVGEFIGTFVLVLMGNGVVASNSLNRSKGKDGGWITITLGWGAAVTLGVYSSGFLSLAHLNPAVSLAMAVAGEFEWGLVIPYIVGQMAGGIVGAMLVWLHYYPHWAETKDSDAILGSFSTAPAIRSTVSNFMSEMIGTAVLVFLLLAFTRGDFTDGLNPIVVGLLILSIGLSLGGTTGYAINPARDLGPRIAHQILPIKNKGDSDWGYAWIPVVGPLVGGTIAALVYLLIPLT